MLNLLAAEAKRLVALPRGVRKAAEPLVTALCRVALARCTESEVVALTSRALVPLWFTAEYARGHLSPTPVQLAVPRAQHESKATALDKPYQVRNRARDIYLSTHREELKALKGDAWRKLGCRRFAALSTEDEQQYIIAARTARQRVREDSGAFAFVGHSEELTAASLLPSDASPRKHITPATLLKAILEVASVTNLFIFARNMYLRNSPSGQAVTFYGRGEGGPRGL